MDKVYAITYSKRENDPDPRVLKTMFKTEHGAKTYVSALLAIQESIEVYNLKVLELDVKP